MHCVWKYVLASILNSIYNIVGISQLYSFNCKLYVCGFTGGTGDSSSSGVSGVYIGIIVGVSVIVLLIVIAMIIYCVYAINKGRV